MMVRLPALMNLPGEALPEARFDGEHVLLGQGHGILDRALVGKLADMGDQERGHVKETARPVET